MTAVDPTVEPGNATRGMNLIRLEWVRRRLAGRAEIAELCAVVAAAGAAAGPVLVDHRFSGWLSRLIRLLDRHADKLLPDGDLRATCAQAGAFTAAIHCLSPAAAGRTTNVRADANGVVALPGTGVWLALPRSYAGVTVRVRATVTTDPPVVEVDLPPGTVTVHLGSESPDDISSVTPTGSTVTARATANPLTARPSMPDTSWKQRWVAAGGRARTDVTRTQWLPGATAELRETLTELGCPQGIPVNSLADSKQRTDPSIDHLSLLRVRSPERYRSAVSRIEAAPDGDVRRLLEGHVAYTERDMLSAATIYADLVVRHPHDVDLWRDLTFAVRHLGDPVPGETWLFHTADVIARAEACEPDPAPLSQLLPSFSRYDEMPHACRFVLGLVEWVRRDLDPR